MNKKQMIISFIISLSMVLLISLSSLFVSFSLFDQIKSTNNSFLIGNSTPLNKEGNNNDIYLDSSSLNIYKKIDGSWYFLLTLKDSSISNKEGDEVKEETKVLHKIEVDNKNSINGNLIPNLSNAYYKETIIFLAKPTNDDYILNKIFFNDKEVEYNVAFLENYALYSTLMTNEDVIVRAEFNLKTS